MESIQGKKSLPIEPEAIADRLANYHNLLVDIGTGDGRFVSTFAKAHPKFFAIGIDTCRENLVVNSRNWRSNALYLICTASTLPVQFYGRTTLITINFPWGSLLDDLIGGNPSLCYGLSAIAECGAVLEIRVNTDALRDAGLSLDEGNEQLQEAFEHYGFKIRSSILLGRGELHALESTWAKRLAFGRDPRALYIVAERI